MRTPSSCRWRGRPASHVVLNERRPVSSTAAAAARQAPAASPARQRRAGDRRPNHAGVRGLRASDPQLSVRASQRVACRGRLPASRPCFALDQSRRRPGADRPFGGSAGGSAVVWGSRVPLVVIEVHVRTGKTLVIHSRSGTLSACITWARQIVLRRHRAIDFRCSATPAGSAPPDGWRRRSHASARQPMTIRRAGRRRIHRGPSSRATVTNPARSVVGPGSRQCR